MTKHKDDGYVDAIQQRMDGDMLKAMLEAMAECVMEEEIARHLRAERHERTRERRGHCNGHKPRSLKTRVGELALRVPQARGVEPYSPLLFAKWERSERALPVACAEMYFMGVSTRKVKRVLEKMGGFELSASTGSCIAQELDEKLAEFRDRRLDGHTWTEVFRELKQRGVTGVEWLVSDGHEGIQAAARTQFDGAGWQRCWTLFMRNALAKVGHKHKAALPKELEAARTLDRLDTCMSGSERVAARWEAGYPRGQTNPRAIRRDPRRARAA